jgi:hypothetical protein
MRVQSKPSLNENPELLPTVRVEASLEGLGVLFSRFELQGCRLPKAPGFVPTLILVGEGAETRRNCVVTHELAHGVMTDGRLEDDQTNMLEVDVL